MRRYIIRRILLFVPVLFGVSVIIFVLMRVVPGDVAELILFGPGGGESISTPVDPQTLAKLRSDLDLDKNLVHQYGLWIWGLLRLDAGESLYSDRPVFDEIKKRFPITFELATLSLIVSVLIAIPIGVISAVKRDTWVDYIFRVLSIGGLAMPSFWTGSLIILFLVLWFNWTPPLGFTTLTDDPWRNLQQIIWPVIALGYLLSAVVSRMTRSTMLEVLNQDYIRTARAKGLMERVVVFRHALKNALLPVVTIVGLQYAFLLGGTVIMEQLFSIPGLGRMLITSINTRDYPMVQALVLLFSGIIVVANLLVDLLYAWLNPQIRYT